MDLILLAADQLNTLVWIAVAMILGSLIGLDREIANKPAGFRTHMLISGAAALFVTLGDEVVLYFETDLGTQLSTYRSHTYRSCRDYRCELSWSWDYHPTQFISPGRRPHDSCVDIAGYGSWNCVAIGQLVIAIGGTLLVLITLRGFNVIEHQLRNH